MKYKVGDIVFSTIWEKSVLIKDIRPNRFYLIADLEYLSRTMVTYESNLKSREDDIEKDMEEHQKNVDEIMAIQGIEPIEAEMEEVWICPEGYIFKDENGNVINTTKIVLEKKKKEYPKTFLGCCDVLGIEDTISRGVKGYKAKLFDTLQKLYICRDAYWKIYGEVNGLGESWKPDWDDGCYVIFTNGDGLIKRDIQFDINAILAFPTEKMRDAFYEAFKKEIEICKELL